MAPLGEVGEAAVHGQTRVGSAVSMMKGVAA